MRKGILFVVLLAAICLMGCRNNVKTSEVVQESASTDSLQNSDKTDYSNLFEYCSPVDLTQIIRAYDWFQGYEGEDGESILYAKVFPDMPEQEFYLFEGTSFALSVPEYDKSKQPFLAKAEDFYNSCAISNNVWSNFEVWLRGNSADLLRSDNDVKQSIKSINVNIIKDPDMRIAAQDYKDKLLQMMTKTAAEWGREDNPMDLLMSFNNVIGSKAYNFYDDKDAFVESLDKVYDFATGMAKHKFQYYIDANETEQVKVILDELASCQNFDEQCSLWMNWANCEKSIYENEWLVAVGTALMESGNYSPILHKVWINWRALCQIEYYGMSRDSAIPNQYYNEYRKKCYVTCLKRIESHPNDVYAMNCAAVIGGRVNINRFGQNQYGNEAMVDEMLMLPKRHNSNE